MILDRAPPVGAAEFARLMAAFAPFESHPALALAVSGGRDSMALAVLARDWAEPRQGTVAALIVDHGLRPESADEALGVQARLAALAIPGTILSWTGDKPRGGLQAAARGARYRLLRAACAERGVLHLLVAHHADDQAETVAMRAGRGSGDDGLAGMAALVELPEVRLLRPLLTVARSRLTSTLRQRAVSWIDDPSNVDPRFERARLRARPLVARRSDDLRDKARDRSARDRALAEAAIAVVEREPGGGFAIDREGLRALAPELQARLLGRLVQCLGGSDHPPHRERVARALQRLCDQDDRGASGRRQDFTLAGAHLLLRQVSQDGRLRWIVRPEDGRNPGQPLVPAPFFACGAPAGTHVV
ncbi:MAG: tRNA lysidine(34) synthetase TilS [Reyranellaceae bacterium]